MAPGAVHRRRAAVNHADLVVKAHVAGRLDGTSVVFVFLVPLPMAGEVASTSPTVINSMSLGR